MTMESVRDGATPFPTHASCLLCHRRDLRALRGYERCHLVRCASCGFVFVARIPTEAELEACYRGKYEENELGYEWLSPVTSKRFNEWLDFMEPFRKQNRILDVGCGAGHFLSHAVARGWEAHGTEYPSNAVERCRNKGIAMRQGGLDPSAYEAGSFDVVTSLGVIEHVTDPRQDLENMVKLLRPGGLLYITTPNFNSVSRHLLRARWNVIMYPEHLSYFTPRTLAAALRALGLEELRVEATGFSVSRVRASLGNGDTRYMTPTCADERLRAGLEGSPALRRLKSGINRVLTMAGAGDELKIQFVKPS